MVSVLLFLRSPRRLIEELPSVVFNFSHSYLLCYYGGLTYQRNGKKIETKLLNVWIVTSDDGIESLKEQKCFNCCPLGRSMMVKGLRSAQQVSSSSQGVHLL
jgi:hypothetical protein